MKKWLVKIVIVEEVILPDSDGPNRAIESVWFNCVDTGGYSNLPPGKKQGIDHRDVEATATFVSNISEEEL